MHNNYPDEMKIKKAAVVATILFAIALTIMFGVVVVMSTFKLLSNKDTPAYFVPQPVPTAENLRSPSITAVWLASTDKALQSPESLAEMMNKAKDAGINTVFYQASWRYATNYPSPTLYQANYAGRDVFQEMLDLGRVLDIDVHAWYTVLIGGNEDSPNPLWQAHGLGAKEDKDKWVVQSFFGQWSDYLNPTIPEVRELAVNTAVELATYGTNSYRPAGVHLDFVRYPEDVEQVSGSEWGYSQRTLDLYQDGTSPDIPETDDRTFLQWKCDSITSLVKEIRDNVKKVNPQAVVSASVVTWGDGPRTLTAFQRTSAVTDVSQCWNEWAEHAYVDMLVPMIYYSENNYSLYHQHWIEYASRLRGTFPDVQIVAGQGAWLNDSASTIEQLKRGKNTLDGFAIYSWESLEAQEDVLNTLNGIRWRNQ